MSDIVKPMKKFGFERLVYAQQFFAECMPIYPLYALMFSERSHLSNAEISALFGIWTIVALLSEVPTGVIADKFSRKAALLLSYAMQSAAFLVWLAFPSFAGYALGFLIWGVGYAFASGTFEAYLFEELKILDRQKSFNKVYARTQSMSLVGMVVAYGVAMLVGAHNYAAALWLSAGLSLVAAGLVILFPYRSRGSRAEQAAESYVATLRSALREVRASAKVRAYVLALALLTGIVGTMEEYTPLFYHHVGFSTNIIPLILASGLLLSSVMSWFAHRLERTKFALVAGFVVAGAVCLYAATFSKVIGLFGVLAFMRLVMLAETLFGATLQHHLEDQRRATVSSLASFGGEILSFITLLVAGTLFANFGDTATYRSLAVGFAVIGIGLVLLGRRRHLRVDPLKSTDVIPPPGRLI